MKRTEPLVFHQPTTLAEATRIMLEGGSGGRFLAGGTDLLIAMKEKGLVPEYVVDLKKIPSLSEIHETNRGDISIGALTTLRKVETSPLIVGRYPFLAQSAAEVGSIQIRNRATIGGNMANATPSADVAPALLALDAKVRLAGADGERVVDLGGFFRGPGQTVAESGEILTELLIPPHDRRLTGEYIKFSPRDMMDLAYIGVSVALVLTEKDETCESVAIALGAVSPTPMRAPNAEAILKDKVLTEKLADEAGQQAAEECSPISDVRASAEYRRAMVRVHTKRALMNASLRKDTVAWLRRRDRRY